MKFSKEQRDLLLKNPNVLKVTKSTVEYTPAFKLEAVEAYQSGQSAREIFEDYGINSSFFHKDYCGKSIRRWIYKLQNDGDESFFQEARGAKATGRPKKVNADEMTVEEMKALIDIQQGVIEKLKKHHASARKK